VGIGTVTAGGEDGSGIGTNEEVGGVGNPGFEVWVPVKVEETEVTGRVVVTGIVLADGIGLILSTDVVAFIGEIVEDAVGGDKDDRPHPLKMANRSTDINNNRFII
jgi:hypothetical protein